MPRVKSVPKHISEILKKDARRSKEHASPAAAATVTATATASSTT